MQASRIVESHAPRATVLIRVLVGWVFLSEGIQKFLFPEALGVGRFIKIGIPAPQFFAPFVGVIEIRVRRNVDRGPTNQAGRTTAADRHHRRYSHHENFHAREVRFLGCDARSPNGFVHVVGSVVPVDRGCRATFAGCAALSQEDAVRRRQLSNSPAKDSPVPLSDE
jgi:hypothetical protein